MDRQPITSQEYETYTEKSGLISQHSNIAAPDQFHHKKGNFFGSTMIIVTVSNYVYACMFVCVNMCMCVVCVFVCVCLCCV